MVYVYISTKTLIDPYKSALSPKKVQTVIDHFKKITANTVYGTTPGHREINLRRIEPI